MIPLRGVAIGGGALLVLAAAFAFEQYGNATYEALTQEDGLVEWATFVAFLVGSIAFVRAGAQNSTPWVRLFLFGLAGFCFFVAGEEISWAQRLIGFQPPEVFLEHNYQQEANLHNLLKDVLDTRWMVLAVALAYGVGLPLAAAMAPNPWRDLAPNPWLVPGFAAVALLEAVYPFNLSGEVAELSLGLCFLADAGLRLVWSVAWVPAAQAVCLAAGFAIVPLTDRLMYGDDQAASALTRAELDRLATALQGDRAVRSKLYTKRRVHKRVYTAIQDNYLRVEAGNWGYFLDAWNQPLWIEAMRTSRGNAHVVLYSFGPNRRRDADDIRVEFDIARRRPRPPTDAADAAAPPAAGDAIPATGVPAVTAASTSAASTAATAGAAPGGSPAVSARATTDDATATSGGDDADAPPATSGDETEDDAPPD